jgi:uncharacterized LabA/DUF88 family protein
MRRTTFLIDGFNFYHSVKELSPRYKWFDYRAYCLHFLRKNDVLQDIYYFTAKAFWRPRAVIRHEILIDVLENAGINVVYGKFKEKELSCPSDCRLDPAGCPKCPQQFIKHEEKATDVNIALYAYHLAHIDAYDKLIVVSGDTDLVPAIQMVKGVFPNKIIGVLYPIGRTPFELRQVADFVIKTKLQHLDEFQLPDELQIQNKLFYRPKEWQ